MYPHLGQHLLCTYSSVNDFPEDGLEGPKHAGGSSESSKYLRLMCVLWDWVLNTTDGFRMAFYNEGWTKLYVLFLQQAVGGLRYRRRHQRCKFR